MSLAFAAVAASLVASEGQAADWWLVGSNSRSAVYHDGSSIRR